MRWKRLLTTPLSISILLTHGVPLPNLAHAMEVADRVPVNGNIDIKWMTSDRITLGSDFNPYDGLEVIDADGDNVAILTKVDGEVNTNRVGKYSINYSITNVDGETFTVTRIVEVIESDTTNLPPTVEVIESDTTNLPPTTEEIGSDATNQELSNEDIESIATESLSEIKWTLVTKQEQQPLIVIGMDTEAKMYNVILAEELKTLLSDMDDDLLNLSVLTVKIISSQNVEKISLQLTVRDLLGESEGLKILNEIPYEFGDQLGIIPTNFEKTTLTVNGVTGGDVSLEQEDYSDGIDTVDFIKNVRFILNEKGLTTLYNQAPIIEGIDDLVVEDFNSFDPKEGVMISDDHDLNLDPQLIVNVESVDETTQRFVYKITDSWGRTTESTRQVTVLDHGLYTEPTPNTSITENTITVKGIQFSGGEENRFDIVFDSQAKKIFVRNQDGKTMNSRFKDETYFSLSLYSSKGELKESIELVGKDRSNSSKLDKLKNNGWRYSNGDYISIYHAESETKLSIAGTVIGSEDENLGDGIPKDYLSTHRFELNPNGLISVKNQAPTITLNEGQNQDLTVSRGDIIFIEDIIEGLTINDDHDDKNLSISTSEYDTNEVGETDVTITVEDTWGAVSTYTRKLIVTPRNNIDGIKINIKNKSGQSVFTFGFDELTRHLTVTNQTSNPLDEGNSSDVLIIRLYSNTGRVKRTIRLKGTDLGNSAAINAFTRYTYTKNDYISIIPVDSSMISVEGNITNLPPGVDYSNQTTLDYFSNVRFQLNSEGNFVYHYNNAPVFNGVENKTIIRGEAFDPLQGVSVTDTEDQNISNDEIKVTYDKESLNKIGITTIRYSVSDSWGRTTTVERKIAVTAAHNLENYQIHFINDNKQLFSLGFDKGNNRIVLTDYMNKEYIPGNEADSVFTLTVYNVNHEQKGSVTLNYEQEINQTFMEQLDKLQIDDGDYITISSPLYESIIVSRQNSITDEVSDLDGNKELLTFESMDQLAYTRFEVSSDGLQAIYNEAPKIIGVEDIKVVYGNPFEEMKGITVEDEESGLEIQVDGSIDTEQLGEQQIIYTVTDSYGRDDYVYRTVTVVPVYTTNEVQYTTEDNRYLISIGVNELATGFTATVKDLTPSQPPQETTLSESNTQQLQITETPSETEENWFKFKVHDESGEIIEELIITNQTVINEALFDDLKATNVHPGYYFSVEANDLTKLKVTGDLNQENHEQISSIDYANLTEENRDGVENVRFKLTENIVEVDYNQAPVIQIQPISSDETSRIEASVSTTLERDKALTKEAYDLLGDVIVSDDKDNLTLTIEHVTVADEMLVSDLESSIATIGQTYDVTYQIQDSWGRASESVTRQVFIKSAMDDVKIKYHRAGMSLEDRGLAITIGFNMETKRLTFDVVSNNNAFKDAGNAAYGTLIITDANGTDLYKKIFGSSDNTVEQPSEFTNGRTNTPSVVQEDLENLEIPYGTKFKFEMMQLPHLFIDGVVNAQEDYSQGAKLGAVLKESIFIVTPEGLKQEYNGIIVDETKSQLTWLNGVAGGQSANVKLNTSNPNNLTFDVDYYGTEPLDTLHRDKLFDIIINDEKVYPINARHYPERFRKVFITGDTGSQPPTIPIESVAPGDYMRISGLVERRLSNLKFYNLCEGYYFPEEVDYSKVITNRDYFDHVRFYFGTQGITPVYNAAPIFKGADEIDVILGSEFNVYEGVTVVDEFDNEINRPLTYTVSSETIDTTQVGQQTITYTATDSWGRTTTHTRTINVRPKLFDNKIQVFGSNSIEQPAFEILFDNQNANQIQHTLKSQTNFPLGRFTIKSHSNESLDLSLATQEVFKIWVVDADGTPKTKVTLLGRDTGNSSKLNELTEIDYCEGDIIKVWRHPDFAEYDDEKIETLRVTGTVKDYGTDNTMDYSSGIENLEKMNNTIFRISNEGLISEYNAAPKIIGLSDKVLYYGEDFDPLQDVSVEDDKGNIVLTEENVICDFIKDRIGDYIATYTVTDSWGRTTSRAILIEVLSKTVTNKIDIYGSDLNKAFTIGFNKEVNRLELTPADNSRLVSSDSFTMKLVIYSRFGTEKANIVITQEDTIETVTEKFTELKDVVITNNDMISIIHTNPNLVRIQGEIVDNSHNYTDGFISTEAMEEVRFKVTNHGLTEVKATDFEIVIENSDTPLEITRGEDYNLTQGVTVVHPNEAILSESISIKGFDINHIGEQTITYEVTDSWGTTKTATREVIVLPKNELENYKIHLMDTTGSAKKLSLGFDAVEMKLTAKLPQQSFISRLFKTLPTDVNVFEVSVYNQHHEFEAIFTLKASDLIDSSDILAQINAQSLNYGYFIEVRAYNYDTGLNFDGDISLNQDVSQSTDFTTIEKQEFITNARFEVTEEGLVAVYNEAPVITGIEVLDCYLYEEYDLREHLKVIDDHDTLTYDNIEVISETLDFYTRGEHNVTYSVTDSWGRTYTENSTIWMISSLQKNTIELKSSDNVWMLKLGFDAKNERLKVEFNNQNDTVVDPSKGENKVYTLSVITPSGTKTIDINGNDTVDTLKTKFSEYTNSYKYTYGHSIHIDIVEESTDKITLSNVIMASDNIPEDSYQGTTSKDYFTNVRFELTEGGLSAIYNHAPIIANVVGDLTAVKSRDLEDYDLLSSLTISDEDYHDMNLSTDGNIIVYYNKADNPENPTNPNNLKLGENIITYIGFDSWGRQSNEVTQTLTLTSAMDDLSITFGQTYDGNASSDKMAMKLTFDMDNGRLIATKIDDHKNDKFKFNDYYSFTFQLYKPNSENSEYEQLYGVYYGNQGWSEEIKNDIKAARYWHNTVSINSAVTDINTDGANIQLEYGMIIRFRSMQVPSIFIDGSVINAQEDYSAGAQINEIINSGYFIITPEGLEQVYEPTVKPAENNNIISWYSGIAGHKQFELTVNPVDQTLRVTRTFGTEPLDTHHRDREIFTITLYNGQGEEQFTKTFIGSNSPSYVETYFRDKTFTIGDYIEIELNEFRRQNLRIFGKVNQSSSKPKIDYSQEVPDISYYNAARFYLTEDGLSLEYNEAPVFIGIYDTTVFKDEPLNLRDGVEVTDDNTENITYKITTESNVTADNFDSIETLDEEFNTSSIGAHQLNYVAKDSRGRITIEPRFIWVYARSEITVPDQSKLTVQQSDPHLSTEEQINQYLIDMVQVRDEEDDKAQKPIQVTKENIEHTFNPNIVGPHDITYTVTDSDGNESSATFTINVVRSINVSVPLNNIPFQVVTNLLRVESENPDNEQVITDLNGNGATGDEFISGTVKIKNNYFTDVNVSVKSLTVSSEIPTNSNGNFTLVDPANINWDDLSEEETMTQMALGLYSKSGLTGDNLPTKDSPIWLTTDINKTSIGVLPKRTFESEESNEAVLSFTAKYGKKFTSGKHKMKFSMVLEFE